MRFVRSPERLLPHAARNRGIAIARGNLFVFTDPDIYAPPEWLAELVAAYERHRATIAGAIDCHGREWLARGMHYSKFDKWLPSGEVRPIRMAPPRPQTCSAIGPRSNGLAASTPIRILGDAIASHRTRKEGLPILFVPRAVVEHHHVGSFGRHLVERFERGREFGRLRIEWKLSGTKLLLQASVTLLPLRLVKLLLRGGKNARRPGRLLDFASASPRSSPWPRRPGYGVS